jgi:hypothetical protein
MGRKPTYFVGNRPVGEGRLRRVFSGDSDGSSRFGLIGVFVVMAIVAATWR